MQSALHYAFNRAVEELSGVNGGVPAGFQTMEDAERAARPGPRAVAAHDAWQKEIHGGRR